MNANEPTTRSGTQAALSRFPLGSRARARGPLLGRVVIALSLAAAWGCTVTTTPGSPDSGGTTPGVDGGTTPDDGATPPPPDAGTTPDTGTTGGGDATVGVLGFTPSNGIEAALAAIDLSKLVDIDVVDDEQLRIDCVVNNSSGCVEMTVVQSDGSSIELYVAKSWKIEPAGVLSVLDKTPVVLVGVSTINVLGLLNVHATADATVAGGFIGMTNGTAGGPGKGTAGVQSVSNVDTGIAGGGGGYCGAGGAAGKATATNGGAGKTYGTPAIVPLAGGSAGGPGSLAPGGGGGAVELVAGTSVTISAGGIVSAGGGAGYDGTDTGLYVASGGGSGGAVLIEAPAVTIAGTVAANGGGGGGGASGTLDAHDATTNATAAPGGQPATTGAGGAGSAGATVAGTAGGAGDAVGGMFSPGAGGGGAGFIRINTTTGVATLGGTLSPAAGSACVSQGTLAH
jgi:hypothetical protein